MPDVYGRTTCSIRWSEKLRFRRDLEAFHPKKILAPRRGPLAYPVVVSYSISMVEATMADFAYRNDDRSLMGVKTYESTMS